MTDAVSTNTVLLWAVQIAWAVIVALAGMVWRDVLRRIREIEQRADRFEVRDRDNVQRVTAVETNYKHISAQLSTIDRKLDRLSADKGSA